MRLFPFASSFLKVGLLLATYCSSAYSAGNGASTRIVGGRLARPNEVPYIVAPYFGTGPPGYGSDRECAGSIISKRFILTAAHCFRYWKKPIPNYRIVAGTLDHTKHENAQVIGVKKYTVHPGFARGPDKSALNDIAIIELEKDLEFNDAVQPIPIPPAGTVPSGPAKVSGWGKTVVNNGTGDGGERPDVLMTVDVNVVPRTICDKLFKEVRHKDIFGEKPYWLSNSTEIGLHVPDSRVLCAGQPGGGKDACGGDSGGPLQCSRMVNGKPEKYLCGIVSYAYGCGMPLPSLYTDVAQFHDWIVENMKE